MNQNQRLPNTVEHEAKCKFCGDSIILQIDESYSIQHDPLKLAMLACCDRCADLRVDRRRITGALLRAANAVAICPRDDPTKLSAARADVLAATKAYCALVADWRNHPFTAFDDDFVQEIMDNPKAIGAVVARLWR